MVCVARASVLATSPLELAGEMPFYFAPTSALAAALALASMCLMRPRTFPRQATAFLRLDEPFYNSPKGACRHMLSKESGDTSAPGSSVAAFCGLRRISRHRVVVGPWRSSASILSSDKPFRIDRSTPG